MEARERILDYLARQLIGPADGSDEFIVDRPHKRYAMGILFPMDAGSYSALGEEQEDNSDDDQGDGDSLGVSDSPVSLSFQRLPSSFGISFVLPGPSQVRFELSASRYEGTKSDGQNGWQRIVIPEDGSAEAVEESINGPGRRRIRVLDGLGELDLTIRESGAGFLVTATLINVQESSSKGVSADKCLFQTGLRASVRDGAFLRYPGREKLSHDKEDRELALIHREAAAYAIGHGCAAIWDESSQPRWVAAEFFPRKEVKPVTTELESGKHDCLGIQYLCDPSIGNEDLEKELTGFLEGYREWIGRLEESEIPDWGKEIASGEIFPRLKEAASRMERGIELLCNGPAWVREVFIGANRAMLRQMIHSGLTDAAVPLGKGKTDPIDYDSAEYGEFAWHPFQLAFQLLSLPSLVGESEADEKERDLVDLIWFPTGGGKTEAYLAVAAFEMISRRIRFGEQGAGTSVIKRYTLRLLTTQQFERAASLIVQLELMRRESPAELGSEPFSLGLWVGGESAPNKFLEAHEKYTSILDEKEPSNPFQLQKCPFCGTSLVPATHSDEREDYGFTVTETFFKFRCPDKDCPCHADVDDFSVGNGIPVSVVDEFLYAHPPSLLIGTIDKFARLAWEPDARRFFGADLDFRPPSLIIQDEMHLISGPLGTIAGVYECAIDTAIRSTGGNPKIIAATATIRRADEQTERLYGREVRIFPPSGLSADDSYFARIDREAPGRMYAGIMAQGHTPVYSAVMMAAAAAQAPCALELEGDELDAYWTLVIYHNSRKELGKTMTLARDDIPARVDTIEDVEDRRRSLSVVEELSANVKGADIPKVLERLKLSAPDPSAIDILPCTNMISVGVDVSRLSLMAVIGQPKTTAEYIQASSRVGRSKKRPPGLVLTLYSNAKPRDRSHYESFTAYHSALYRYVEPTSVTPFAPPSRERALHASLVTLMRMAGGFISNESAGQFDPEDTATAALIRNLLERMDKSEPREASEIAEHLKALVETWSRKAADGRLRFRVSNRAIPSLLKNFGEDGDAWPTLHSMRSVDAECLIRVLRSSITVANTEDE